MTYNPSLLVSADFLLTAAILRHFEKQRVSTANRLYALTEFPRHKDWGMHLPESHPDVIWFTTALDRITGREEEQAGTLTSMYNESPLAKETAAYKGLGPGKLVARFLGEIGDPYLQICGLHQGRRGDHRTPGPHLLPAQIILRAGTGQREDPEEPGG